MRRWKKVQKSGNLLASFLADWRTIGVLFAVMFGVYLLYQFDRISLTTEQIAALVTFAAFAAALNTYTQWVLGRREATYEKFYDRLKTASEATDRYWTRLHEQVADKDEAARRLTEHRANMAIYTELDNLEYMLGKWRLRYADRDMMDRAMRHFFAIMQNMELNARLFERIGTAPDIRQAWGYEEGTCIVARFIGDKAKDPKARWPWTVPRGGALRYWAMASASPSPARRSSVPGCGRGMDACSRRNADALAWPGSFVTPGTAPPGSRASPR